MRLLPSRNKNFKNLLCFIDVFTKYARAKPVANIKITTVLNALIKIVN